MASQELFGHTDMYSTVPWLRGNLDKTMFKHFVQVTYRSASIDQRSTLAVSNSPKGHEPLTLADKFIPIEIYQVDSKYRLRLSAQTGANVTPSASAPALAQTRSLVVRRDLGGAPETPTPEFLAGHALAFQGAVSRLSFCVVPSL